MKFLALVLTFIMLVPVSFAGPFGENSFNADGTVKSRYKRYKMVKNGEGSSFDQGDVVCMDDGADDGISVDYCAALGDPAVCMIDEACDDGKMCKCLVEGFTDALDFNGGGDNAVAGKPVFGDVSGLAQAATTPTAGHKVIGVFLDAASATGAVEAYLQF